MKEEVQELRQEVKEIKKQSAAMEILTLAKHQNEQLEKNNKRLFWIIMVLLVFWLTTIGAFLYYINTTGFEEITETAETTDGGNACVGDNCNNGEITYGESNEKN